MDDVTTELLARVEVLESEVKELRDQIEGGGIVFEFDETDPEMAFFFGDDDTQH